MLETNLSEAKIVGTNKIDLQVLFFEEDDIHFAYMPSLDLTGYGNNIDEAKESICVVVDEFLRYTIDKNSLLSEMQRLGWKVMSNQKAFFAPKMSELINTNDQLKEIINSKQYTTNNYQVSIPSFT